MRVLSIPLCEYLKLIPWFLCSFATHYVQGYQTRLDYDLFIFVYIYSNTRRDHIMYIMIHNIIALIYLSKYLAVNMLMGCVFCILCIPPALHAFSFALLLIYCYVQKESHSYMILTMICISCILNIHATIYFSFIKVYCFIHDHNIRSYVILYLCIPPALHAFPGLLLTCHLLCAGGIILIHDLIMICYYCIFNIFATIYLVNALLGFNMFIVVPSL